MCKIAKMERNKTSILKTVELLQEQRDNIVFELEQLLITKENEFRLMDTIIVDKISNVSHVPFEYNENLPTIYPTSIFLGSEGFMGLTHDLKPVYEIATRINLLTLKSYSSDAQLTHINSSDRFHIWQKLIDDYSVYHNIIFVFDQRIHESIFNIEKQKLKGLIESCNKQLDELVDMIICEDEMKQYEDLEDELFINSISSAKY